MFKKALLTIVVLALAVSAFAKEKDRDDWKEIIGFYQGETTVANELGYEKKSELQMQVRTGEHNCYIVELLYFKNDVARFAKVKRTEEFKLKIHETVHSQQGEIMIDGALSSCDGKNFSGKITYKKKQGAAGLKTFRTFDVKNLCKGN